MPENEFHGKNNQAKQKHEQANAVNAVHVFNKRCLWPVGIGFAQI